MQSWFILHFSSILVLPVVWIKWGKYTVLESPPSMPADVLGVALKETDYIAFECQAFDTSGVGFYEIVMANPLK